MVSTAKYVQVFVKVFPQRIRDFRKLRDYKRSIDTHVQNSSSNWERSRQILLEIIGESSIFKSAEKRGRKSMRHGLWKLIKSLEVFVKTRGKIISLATRSSFSGIKVEDYLRYALDYSENVLKILYELDELYRAEVSAIKDTNYNKYLELVKLEEGIEKRIVVGYGYKRVGAVKEAVIETFADKISKFKNFWNRSREDMQAVEGAAILLTCAIILVITAVHVVFHLVGAQQESLSTIDFIGEIIGAAGVLTMPTIEIINEVIPEINEVFMIGYKD